MLRHMSPLARLRRDKEKALLGCCKGKSLQLTAALQNLGSYTKKMEEMEMGEWSAVLTNEKKELR